MQPSKRSESAARISCAKEQPSCCLLHADWMMLNNALLQMPHVGGESGAYSRMNRWREYVPDSPPTRGAGAVENELSTLVSFL